MNKLILICTLFFSITVGWYTRNLTYNNDESLFLNVKQTSHFQQFKQEFSDLPTIIVAYISPNTNLIHQKMGELEGYFKTINIIKNEKNILFQFIDKDYYAFTLQFLESTTPKAQNEVINYLLKQKSNQLDIKIIGYPYNNYLLDQVSENINSRSFPQLFLICFIILLLIVRNIKNSILLFLPALNAALIGLLIIKFQVGSLNAINSITPLLNFVIYLTLVLHLYYSDFALKRKLLPTFLTVITTAIGFGSLIISDILIIKEFAVSCALSIIINFIVVYFNIYLLKPLFVKKTIHYHFLIKLVRKFEMKPSLILILSLMLVGGSVLSFSKIKVNTNLVDFFTDKIGLRETLSFFEQKIMGLPTLEILIDKDLSDFEFDKLMSVKEQELLNKLPGIKIISKARLIEAANFAYTQNKTIPSNINAYAGLISGIPPSLISGYQNERLYRITLLGPQLSFNEYNKFLQEVKTCLTTIKINNYTFGGFFYSVVVSHYSILELLIWSFFSSCLIIFIIIAIYFRNYKLVLIFSLINLVPISSLFLFLNLMHFSINLATVKVFSISLGLMVDNAIHICYEKKLDDNLIAPILFGAIILIISFFVLGFNDFIPLKEFAFSMIYLLAIGLVYSLFILPQLLKKIKVN